MLAGASGHGDSSEEETNVDEQEPRSRDFLGGSQIKAALGRSKYQQLVDTDESEDRDEHPRDDLNLELDRLREDSTKDQVESLSSYAEDEDEQGRNNDVGERNDFGYQELDDEYGSRPVKAGISKRWDNEALPNISSQSGQRVEGRDVALGDVSGSGSGRVGADRVVGHEYGVRPLLEDDELQLAYGLQQTGVSKPLPNAEVLDFVNTGSSILISSQISSLSSPHDNLVGDVFAAAPFRKNSKRRTPSSMLGTGSSSAQPQGNVFALAPFKQRSSGQSQESSKTVSPADSTTLSQTTLTAQSPDSDIFGNAPFGGKHTPSSTATGPSSNTVSPQAEDLTVCTPDDAVPASGAAGAHSRALYPMSLSPDTSLSAHAFITPSCPLPSRPTQLHQVPATIPKPPFSAEDPFGAVPFNHAVKQSRKGGKPGNASNFVSLSGPLKAKLPLSAIEKSVEMAKHVGSQGDWVQEARDTFELDTQYTWKQTSDQLAEAEDQIPMVDSAEVRDSGQYQRLKTRNKRTNRDIPSRDVSSAAFSNMSFNDEDEGELDSPTQEQGKDLSLMGSGAHPANMGASHSIQNLHISSIRHPAYAKGNSPPVVTNASSESLKVSSGGYDCGTWPRKHKRLPPGATAEPFTVKKK